MNKRTNFLILLLAIMIIFLAVIQGRYSSTIDKGAHSESHYLTQQIVAADIINKITYIESLAYKIPLTATRQKLLNSNISKLKKSISDTRSLIDLLENGGKYVAELSLNSPNQSQYKKQYEIPKPATLSPHVIHLKPRIALLDKMTIDLQNLTQRKIKAKMEHKPLNSIGRDISLFSKSLDSIFRRIKEDANLLYVDAQSDHTKALNQIHNKKRRYDTMIIMMALTIFLLLVILVNSFVQTLRYRLYHDRLTGLSSRTRLEESQFGENALLILIDIDDFSDINSLYGMTFGNKILKNLADKLKHFDPGAKAYRVAGDIFGLYYRNFTYDESVVQEKIDAVRMKLKDCKKCNMEISVTIGAAKGSDCLHDAYMALDIANTKGEPDWIYHDESAYIREVKFNRLWHDELKSALDHDAIVPFFQPIVNKNKDVTHYETLMRLRRSNGKTEYISPAIFLEVAKKTKLYLPISRRVIEKAFEFFSDKLDKSFTINLSYEDMEKEGTQTFLQEMIERHNARGRVVFEVLETSFIDNPELLENFISHFRSLGVKFAIDDFGTGYSNLKRVVSLNPDYLKIDGSLIQAMLHDKKSRKMVEYIVEFAKEFEIKTVAEYVSSPELFSECKRLDMDYCQGYYFAEPSPQLEF